MLNGFDFARGGQRPFPWFPAAMSSSPPGDSPGNAPAHTTPGPGGWVFSSDLSEEARETISGLIAMNGLGGGGDGDGDGDGADADADGTIAVPPTSSADRAAEADAAFAKMMAAFPNAKVVGAPTSAASTGEAAMPAPAPAPAASSADDPPPPPQPTAAEKLASLDATCQQYERSADNLEARLAEGQPPLPKSVFGSIRDQIAALYGESEKLQLKADGVSVEGDEAAAAAEPEAKRIVREARKACTARCERLCTRVMALHGRVAERKGEAAAAHKVGGFGRLARPRAQQTPLPAVVCSIPHPPSPPSQCSGRRRRQVQERRLGGVDRVLQRGHRARPLQQTLLHQPQVGLQYY